MPSLPPSRRAAAWGSRSAARSLNRTAVVYGPRPTTDEARASISLCQPLLSQQKRPPRERDSSVLRIRSVRKISDLQNPPSRGLSRVNYAHDPVSSGFSLLVRCLFPL